MANVGQYWALATYIGQYWSLSTPIGQYYISAEGSILTNIVPGHPCWPIWVPSGQCWQYIDHWLPILPNSGPWLPMLANMGTQWLILATGYLYWPILVPGHPFWPIWVPRDPYWPIWVPKEPYMAMFVPMDQYWPIWVYMDQYLPIWVPRDQYWPIWVPIACSRLLERCAKKSARGRKRGGNGGEKERERRGACNHFLKHLMPVYQLPVYLLIGQF